MYNVRFIVRFIVSFIGMLICIIRYLLGAELVLYINHMDMLDII